MGIHPCGEQECMNQQETSRQPPSSSSATVPVTSTEFDPKLILGITPPCPNSDCYAIFMQETSNISTVYDPESEKKLCQKNYLS